MSDRLFMVTFERDNAHTALTVAAPDAAAARLLAAMMVAMYGVGLWRVKGAKEVAA